LLLSLLESLMYLCSKEEKQMAAKTNTFVKLALVISLGAAILVMGGYLINSLQDDGRQIDPMDYHPSATWPEADITDIVVDEELSIEVSQYEVEAALNNIERTIRQARTLPSLTDENKIQGFRIIEIESSSLYEEIGLRNDDILRRINDEWMVTLDNAMDLFDSLQIALNTGEPISIDLLRDGRGVRLDILIR